MRKPVIAGAVLAVGCIGGLAASAALAVAGTSAPGPVSSCLIAHKITASLRSGPNAAFPDAGADVQFSLALDPAAVADAGGPGDILFYANAKAARQSADHYRKQGAMPAVRYRSQVLVEGNTVIAWWSSPPPRQHRSTIVACVRDGLGHLSVPASARATKATLAFARSVAACLQAHQVRTVMQSDSNATFLSAVAEIDFYSTSQVNLGRAADQVSGGVILFNDARSASAAAKRYDDQSFATAKIAALYTAVRGNAFILWLGPPSVQHRGLFTGCLDSSGPPRA